MAPVRLAPILTRSEVRMQDVRPNLPGYYLRHPAALLRRIGAALRFGLVNHYLTIAWRSTR